MMKIKILFISVFILSSCSNKNECGQFEISLIHNNLKVNELKPIFLDSISNGKWDRVGVFHGPVFPQEVKKRLGIRYHDVVPDGCRQYIFVKGNEIVSEEVSYGCNLDFIMFQPGNYLILHDTSTIYLKRKVLESGTYFRIWDKYPSKNLTTRSQ